MPGKLYMRIAREIRGLIEQGVFQPGERLPPLRELAQRFGVSRATVREALSTLRGQGLVEFRHGDGTYVRTASVEMWMEPLEAAILLATGEAEQLTEMLVSLLAGIAHVAAGRPQVLDWAALAHRLYQVECAQELVDEAIAAEIGFYLELACSSGNALLENALRVLQEALRSVLRLLAEQDGGGLETCRAVFDAVRVGDPVRARNAVYDYGSALQARVRALRAGNGHKPG